MSRAQSGARRLSGALITLLALGAFVRAQAQPAEHGHRGGPQPHPEFYDARHNHNQYYFNRGAVVEHVTGRPFVVARPGGAHFYYRGGVWYAPRPAGGFVVVGAPVGVFVPVLPPFYTTVWFAGAPYYYANDTYYVWRGDEGYEVVAPPGAAPDPQPEQTPPDAGYAPLPPEATVVGGGLFVYPQSGQSPEQQAADRYECHSWAASQTGFDPTQSAPPLPPEQLAARRGDYQRAERACLEGRGYSVR